MPISGYTEEAFKFTPAMNMPLPFKNDLWYFKGWDSGVKNKSPGELAASAAGAEANRLVRAG